MGQSPLWSHCDTFPPRAASVASARGFVVDRLIEHDLGHLLDDIQLVTSELVTNAVRHAQTPFTVLLEGSARKVRLTVTDDSADQPKLRRASVMDTDGRGLRIVERCSGGWGVSPARRNAKSVWASFDVHSSPADG